VEEVESLKRDKNVLMMELVNLRTKQQVCRALNGEPVLSMQMPAPI
jgi:hypothetical protein